MTTIRWIALLAIAGSGGVHLLIVPEQLSHSLAHGGFFLLVGLAQISWAVAFWRFPARFWLYIGLGLSGGLVTLWTLTQLVSAPYAHAAEPFDVWLITSKLAEIVGYVALVGYLIVYTLEDSREPPVSWTVVGAVTLTLGFGIMVWGAGHFAEAAAPNLGHTSQTELGLPHHHTDHSSPEGGLANNSDSDQDEAGSADHHLPGPATGHDEHTRHDAESVPDN